MKLRLIQTCGGCPEQYDVYYGNQCVGYMRLRHGYFYAEHERERVYEARTKGDGLFEIDERHQHLQAASLAILAKIVDDEDNMVYEIEQGY